jgi:hypothetical protein
MRGRGGGLTEVTTVVCTVSVFLHPLHNQCCLTLRLLFGLGMVPHAPTHLLLTATGLNDVPSNIADRPNHLHCNFKSHPPFLAALSSPLSITTYVTICKTNRSSIFYCFNHCIHNTSLYTHFTATILTHLCKFTLHIVFLDQLS